MLNLPKARNENIIVQEIGDEVMIYDTVTDKAFCLNATCAVIFNHCDGRTTFERIRRQYGYTDEIIHFALGELERIDLLAAGTNDYFAGLSRREVIKKVGLSSMVAIPLISSLAAPRAAQAASGTRANGVNCNTNNQCASNRCGFNGFGPTCCTSNPRGACTNFRDCCGDFSCVNQVCCDGPGSMCVLGNNICCAGLTCVSPNGQPNGTCQ